MNLPHTYTFEKKRKERRGAQEESALGLVSQRYYTLGGTLVI